MRKLRGVCIGAGYFSHYHYEAWQRIPEVEIVAFSNRDQSWAQVITDRIGLDKCYPDYREMFDKEKPDFVDVITPPPSHRAICGEAAAREYTSSARNRFPPVWRRRTSSSATHPAPVSASWCTRTSAFSPGTARSGGSSMPGR